MTENMVLNWEKASANSEGRLAQILTQLVSALELHGRSIVKLEANVASLTEQATALERADPAMQEAGYMDGLMLAPLQTKFFEAVMGVINHNAETIAESVWQEIEGKVDDTCYRAADYAIEQMDAEDIVRRAAECIDAADIVRRGLKDIL